MIAIVKKIPIEFSLLFCFTTISLFGLTVFQLLGIANVAQPNTLLNILLIWVESLAIFGLLFFFTRVFIFCKKQFPNMPLIHAGIAITIYFLVLSLFVRCFSIMVASSFAAVNGGYVIQVSSWYLSIDTYIGTYSFLAKGVGLVLSVPYALSYIDFTYRYTVTVVVIAPFLIALFSSKIARQYILSLLVATAVCVPFWFAAPALAPLQLATFTSINQFDTTDIVKSETVAVRNLFDQYQNTEWGSIVSGWDGFWETTYVLGWGLPISCNPSMHVIWGVLLAFYLRKINLLLGIAGGVFLLSEMIGTVFFLQHYLIDIVLGLVVSVLVIFITNKALDYEKKYLSADPGHWFSALAYLELLGAKIKSLISK